ncbi:hypothetical protein [Desulfurispira natronophila]|uniref:Uncharacterized protein n=1 Tax=Desulfurispira natronophila TaxID=682562 RepID=A0A7W7Y572_9BACT|nr:hypothetical protein [Desulfurispira natronophila]MBB5022318.1 hypothetical protein [Desulfurispira natronophila]
MVDPQRKKYLIGASVAIVVVWIGWMYYQTSFAGWSDEEVQNIQNLMYSLEATAQAQRIVSSGLDAGYLSDTEARRLLDLQREALRYARKLDDRVLAKSHRELPEHFRQKYQRGLELFKEDIKQQLPGSVTVNEPQQMEEWRQWISTYRQRVQVPPSR